MKFKFSYKGHAIEVEINEDNTGYGSFFSIDYGIVRVTFSGKTNWYASAIGGQFHDELERILKENHCNSFKINEGKKGTTTFGVVA